ncbi:uncharacterized protein LOC144333635 [Macaca mulatta]
MVTHSFLVVPECPYPLLGRDLLTKLGAQIHFSETGAQVLNRDGQPIQILTVSLQDEHRLFDAPVITSLPDIWLQDFPQAWAETGGLGLAKYQAPIIIDLKPTAVPVSIKQYPMSQEAHIGIRQHINKFLELGVLRPCRSPWNTPLLPVKKPGTQDYRPVQDLREINKRTMDIHPTVPNPYNLLSTLKPGYDWYTVLDLKDAFFCLPLAPQSQELFAFEWKDPEKGISGQLTWTRLPQGFKNSPTLFDEALHRDLTDFRTQNPDVTLLQYVDDLLLAAPTKEICIQEAIVRQPPDRWITNARLTHYQALLLDTDRVQFGPPVTLNPATLLPVPEDQPSPHDCRQVLAETHGTREDLKDQELPDADHTWYTDGSSYLDSGTRRAGAAVVDGHNTIWAQSLPPGTSAQKAELIALTKALELSKGKKANIYTDSRYAFATAHTHGSIYERRGLLTSEGKEIKNKAEIIALLKALFLPQEVAIIHCPGHQKGQDPVAVGNRQADQVARQAAMAEVLTLATEPDETSHITIEHTYTPEDQEEAKAIGAIENKDTKNWEKGGKIAAPGTPGPTPPETWRLRRSEDPLKIRLSRI